MDATGRYVRIDVAKAKLDVFIARSGESFSGANSEPEIARMLRRLGPGDFVILEATGGLETLVASALAAAGIAAGDSQSPPSARLRPRHRTPG